jgi:hypothetical protein
MAGIFCGKALTGENVPQVRSAIAAKYFGTAAIGIGFVGYGARYLIVETWPAAKRFKLIFRPVQRSIAAAAYIQTLRLIVEQLAGKGALGTFV